MEFEHKVGALDDEDLVVGEKEEKNWKGIVISLLVIGSILGAIIIAITLCTPTNDVDNNKFKLDFDHVISDTFKERPFNGTWLSEHELVYVDQNGSIVIFDAKTNRSDSMLVKTHDKTLHTMTKFSLSSDRQSILFVADEHYEFGAPVSIRYAIFNISIQTVEFLDDIIRSACGLKNGQIQYAAWGYSANSIVFIASNDIFYVPDFTRTSNGKCLRLTKTGQLSESIKNGLPDSFYRNTLFQDTNEVCLWWSKDGRYLAYLSFDDAAVESLPIDYYDNYLLASNNNPRIHYERYPRAGTNLPRVTVHVADMGNSINVDTIDPIIIPLPIEQLQPDPKLGFYISYVEWVAEKEPRLLVLWSNRAQNSSVLSECGNYETPKDDSFFARRSSAWRCNQLTTFSQRIPPNVDARKTILVAHNSNGSRLIFVTLPRPDSEIGEHYHLALLRSDERAPKYNVYLTHGEFDVDSLVAYDAKTDSLYFEVKIAERAERHLYKMKNVAQNSIRQTRCLTCNLEEACSYSRVYMSPGFKYLVHECLGPTVPVTRMRLLESDHLARLRDLNLNEALENLVKNKQMPLIQYIAVPTNQQYPYKCHIKMYLPNEIEEEKDKRFPLLIESSEIDQRKIWKKFEVDWGQYLASRKQLIYARVDCIRTKLSSSGQSSSATSGAAWNGDHDELLADSPLFNAKDQIESIKFLLDNVDHFPYIDRRRVAIWGPTSTSAYVALATTASDDSKLIHCTIAVSPITNWRYMNAYMAEHYLGQPSVDSNSLKYERANLLKRTYDFAMRKLLVVHGTADEQVHVQNTMQFVKALTEHHMIGGFIHQMQLYPDIGHSLAQVKRHFYLTLDGFIDRCFYQKPIAIKATEWKGKVRPKLY